MIADLEYKCSPSKENRAMYPKIPQLLEVKAFAISKVYDLFQAGDSRREVQFKKRKIGGGGGQT